MRNIFFLLFLILISCRNSTEKSSSDINPEITDNDIYEIVNLVIQEKDEAMKKDGIRSDFYEYVLDRDLEPLFGRGLDGVIQKRDTIFSKEDWKFIQKQIELRKNFKYDGKFIKSKKIISNEEIKPILIENRKNLNKGFYEIYEEKFGQHYYYTIGLPIFSRDKKKVFIKFDEFGSGFTAIYIKVNGKWKYYYSISSWIA